MPKDLRLGKDPLGALAPSPAGNVPPEPGGAQALDRILAATPPAQACPPCPPRDEAGMAAVDSDASERARAFLDDLIDGADVIFARRPELSVEMEGDLADLSMQDAYLLGHALRILLGFGVGGKGKKQCAAALRIRLTSRLSGRSALSVTDDGTFFPEGLSVLEPADRDMWELVTFVTGRGGSVLVTRLVATEVAVVIWNRAAVGNSPRVNA
ncbi:hypothetical protein [Desulfolutivibrio sulfoxidireducens]|uniref:hypothetical protein n=1 Tax=Desulfolutivibrio sulfoxidireducens TaxID=2773299 RepID=UPI00159E47CE|nr:hypothetical protein [Desulfolutivibrio sulfoxidireducens]QLA17750.1 hypothetical protein GD605_17520 [Desulfolutivibrio sulfoxidireducens]QLA21326.1 hypothetical protein GD604_17130 [Desulfolutivibrio sulfoxidireducens]